MKYSDRKIIMKEKITPRAVIFDLDGTLVDSLPDIATALNRALVEAGLERAESRDVRAWIGDGIRVLCERALAAQNAHRVVDEIVQSMREAYDAAPADETTCFPNVLKMLDLLKNRGTRIAVVTNKPHLLATRVVELVGLANFIEIVHGCRRDDDKKPSPIYADAVAQAFGIPAREFLFVGDSSIDVETARRAGMSPIAVTWGYSDRAELTGSRPDAMIDDPMEIFSLSGPLK